MSNVRIKEKTLFAYIAMTFSFMGGCSIFQGNVGTLQWGLFYYGSVIMMLLLSIYYIFTNRNTKVSRKRNYYIILFCAPRVIMLIYSCVIWIITNTAFPYISRGISNTLFQCIAYFCGVCFACGENDDILKITLASSITVFSLAYIIGFMENGVKFIYALNPFSSYAYEYSKYTELHELAYIIGLYLLVHLIIKKNTSLKKENTLFWLSLIVFFIAWKRIGIFALILVYILYLFLSKIKCFNKAFCIRIIGIIGIVACICYVSLIVSGTFVKVLQSFGINFMGRDIIYNYFRKFADFSVGFIGKGVGFVTRQFDYATRDDLYNMVSIKAIHNDFFKIYIEIGFVGFVIWLIWWLVKIPKILCKKCGVEKAFICFMFILYAFILYTTDNAESYTNFQLQLSALITYIACFYTKEENDL